MAYEPTIWKTGDIVSSEKLNKLENGLASVGLPTDEQTAQAVSDWLDKHPEATTTVQDGAITYEKLSTGLKEKCDDVDDLKADLSESVGDLKGVVNDIAVVPVSINHFDESTYVGGYYIDNKTGNAIQYKNWGYITINLKPGNYYLCGIKRGETQYETINDLYNGYFSDDTFVSGQYVSASSSDHKIVVPKHANIAKISAHDYVFNSWYEKLMIVTTDYYNNNVADINDYVPYSDSDTIKIKESALPDIISENIDELLHKFDFMTIISGERAIFSDEVSATIASIEEHTDTPSFVMTLVTDPHVLLTDELMVSRAEDTFKNINAVTRYCWADGLSILGDMIKADVAGLTQADADKTIRTVMGWGQYCNTKVFGINGNHDGIGGSVPRTDNYATMLRLNEEYVVRENGNPYYYIDYPHHKIRAIYLCTNQQVGNTHIYGVGNEQLTWFSDTLTSTPLDFDIIIFSHIGTFDTRDFKTNRTECCTVLNQWIATANGKCIGWYCGHEHLDCIVPTSSSGINCPQVVLQCSLMSKWTPTPEYSYIYNLPWVSNNREADTVSQDCWTTLCYNKADNKVYLVRFGAGDDMTIDLTQY